MHARQIEAFRFVMVTGTTTGAASSMSITQPAVSRLIADLESEGITTPNPDHEGGAVAAATQQVPGQDGADRAGPLAGADQGDRRRLEQEIQVPNGHGGAVPTPFRCIRVILMMN